MPKGGKGEGGLAIAWLMGWSNRIKRFVGRSHNPKHLL